MSVSLTMIVRNEEHNLPHCLASVRGLFDEIVIVDTGSTDRTPEIARSFGARVFEFAWVDDFAVARNVALDHATGDYAATLDADEVIDPAEREKLADVLSRLRPGADTAIAVHLGEGLQTSDRVLVWPRRPDVRWAYPIHEQILPSLYRAGMPVAVAPVTIRHTGYADTAVLARKCNRNAAILAAWLASRPTEVYATFLAAKHHRTIGRVREAIELYRGVISDPAASWMHSWPHKMLAAALGVVGDRRGGLAIIRSALDRYPGDAPDAPALWWVAALAYRNWADRPDLADHCCRRILEFEWDQHSLTGIDPGHFGGLARARVTAM